MNSTRLFRILICALVICSLLISWSPIRANATMVTTGTIVAVSVLPVVTCVLGGLGIAQAAAIGSTALQPIVESCIAHLQELGLCQETTIEIFGYKLNGISVFGVTPRLIEAIRSWLFDNEILVDTGASEGFAYYNGNLFPVADSVWDSSVYPYAILYVNPNNGDTNLSVSNVPFFSDEYGWIYCQGPFSATNYDISSLRPNIWSDAGGTINNGTSKTLFAKNRESSPLIWSNVDMFDTKGNLYFSGSDPVPAPSVESSLDLELGVVAPSTESLEVGYPDWYNNSTELTDPNTEKQVTVLPIPSVSTYENALSIPQDQIWQGINTGTNTGTDSGTSSDTWQPPSNPGQFALDLTKYFPFCIPFDLYDLFTCLNADPVAPVIHWELPMPGGSTYPIELDLSPFNSVAQLLRRMQLLLFCVGLAIKTRDLIKG